MSILVVTEHDNASLRPVTLSVVAAAVEIGGEIDLLVAGNACQSVADEASNIPDVARVRLADNAVSENTLAENLSLIHI